MALILPFQSSDQYWKTQLIPLLEHMILSSFQGHFLLELDETSSILSFSIVRVVDGFSSI